MNTAAKREKETVLQLDSAAFTHPGEKRELNQDTVFHQTSQTNPGEYVGLFLVCDGLDGHKRGSALNSHLTPQH